MPRINIDYSKSIIYKLVHKDDYENVNVYIGSTTDFKSRKNRHKHNCNNPTVDDYNIKVYQYIRQNGGFDEWIMVEVEKFPCIDKREADARERYWCEHYKSKLNCQVPGRTHKEWKKDNKEHIDKYTEDNKEHIKEYHAEWYQKNKEEHDIKAKTYREENKEKSKIYFKNRYQQNKDKWKQNYLDNIEKHKEKDLNRKITCDKCGTVVKSHLKGHKKTQKCVNFVPILDIQNP